MSRKIIIATLAVCLALGMASMRLFSAEEAKEEVKPLEFKGVKQCVNCHKELDNSVEVWQGEKHSKAFEALATEEAKAFSKDPQNDPKCLKCHTTGYDQPGGYALKLEDKKKEALTGVTCESCHGPGEKYNTVMMQAKMKGNYSTETAAEAGLLVPDEKTCLTCHNDESPTFKEFDYEKMVAKIKHGEKLKTE